MESKHDHRCEDNSHECFETFTDHKLLGTFSDQQANGEVHHWLVFDCGWALVISHRGDHRVEDPKNVGQTINHAMNYHRQVLTWSDKALRVLGLRK